MLGLTSGSANAIYTAYIRHIIDYCDTVWNCYGIGNSLSLERFQRHAAKIVSKMSNSDRALDYLKWPSLVNRQESAILMNSSKGVLKDNSCNLKKNYFTFNSSVHNQITRQMNLLHLPRIGTDLAKNSFITMVLEFLIR